MIKFFRGTRSALDAKAAAGTIDAGRPYYITDESRIAIGVDATHYVAFAKESEAGGGGGTVGPLYESGTPFSFTNNVAKQTAATIPIPANELVSAVDFAFDGSFLNTATARTITFELSYGGVVFWTDASGSIATNAAAHPFKITGKLFRKNGVTNAIGLSANLDMATAGTVTTGIGDGATVPSATTGMSTIPRGDQTVDSTVAQNLVLAVTVGGTAVTTYTFNLDYAIAYHPGTGNTGATGSAGTSGAGTGNVPLSGAAKTASFNTDSTMPDHETEYDSVTDGNVTVRLADFSADGQIMAFRAVNTGMLTAVAGAGVTLKKSVTIGKTRTVNSPMTLKLRDLSSGIVNIDGDVI